MKLVLHTGYGEQLPCADWPTAIVGMLCRGGPAYVERLDAPSDKTHKITLFKPADGSKSLFGWRDTADANMRYLTRDELDRLMAGEDL